MFTRYTLALLCVLGAATAQTVTVNYFAGINQCGPDDAALFSMSGTIGTCYQARASATANCSRIAECDGLAYPDMLDCLGATTLESSLRVLADGSTEAWTTSPDCAGEPSTLIGAVDCPIMWGALCDGRYTDYSPASTAAAPSLGWM